MPASKITAASAPRSSCAIQSTIEWPPISSSPSQAKRTFTGSAPSAASSRRGLAAGGTAAPCRRRPRARRATRPRIVGSNGGRLPEIERIGRLDVEMSVDEHGRRAVGVHRRAKLADRERPAVEVDQLTLAARVPDERREPLAGGADVVLMRRVGADAGDAQPLGELVEPGGVERGHGRRNLATPRTAPGRRRSSGSRSARSCRNPRPACTPAPRPRRTPRTGR